MQQWFEIELSVPEALREPIINRLFELGAEGVNESEDSSQAVVRGFFQERHRDEVSRELPSYLTSLAEIFPDLPKVELQLKAVPQENWAERWKDSYQAQKLTKLFFLKPAWDATTPVPEGMIPLVMEPGQAFGTGLHASTNLCLRLLAFTVELFPRTADLRVIDVGTGTGILAIAAAKLGVGRIEAFDIDPVAVEAAVENCALNGTPDIDVKTAQLADYAGPYDIVLSNILLETHRELASEYARVLKPGGQIILAGLLAHQRDEINEIMAAQGFVLEGSESLQEWIAIAYRRGN